jgi:beta-lactam-binding protein with PASTA domain
MASRKLEAAGFSVYVKYLASQVPHGKAIQQRALELGQVVGQKPAGESPIKNGRKVLLVISLGPHRRPPHAR